MYSVVGTSAVATPPHVHGVEDGEGLKRAPNLSSCLDVLENMVMSEKGGSADKNTLLLTPGGKSTPPDPPFSFLFCVVSLLCVRITRLMEGRRHQPHK